MKNTNKEQDLFHLFIQYADKLPAEAAVFPYFDFMDHSIRKAFNQLKKGAKKEKKLQAFEEIWSEFNNEDKVKLYCNWVILLKKSLELEKNISLKLQPESITIQDQIYIRKAQLFNKWEKKIAKLTPTHLHVIGRKNREFELKYYQIRKSKSKQNFGWVLRPIVSTGKSLHCEVGSQSMFDEWYYALTVNINNQRIEYFLNGIKQERMNPGSLQKKIIEQNKGGAHKQGQTQKTLTEIMIDKQMKSIDNDNYTQIDQNEDEFESMEDEKENREGQRNSKAMAKKQSEKDTKQQRVQSNPNIFQRLAPDYGSLLNFADTPFNSALVYCDSEYRIYELPRKQQSQQIILKMFTVLPHPKSLVFHAIATEAMGWNDQVDTFTIKTKISSENSALIYEKNKAQGLLYRERDFLYLRHCFSIANLNQPNTFIIDKSIDSIHHPPFMSVVRAEKKLIWGLIQKQNSNECILVIEGWIKGGGYMNQLQNKDMTIKYMKKLNNLKGFLKQLSFTHSNQNHLFQENWSVDLTREESGSENKIRSKSFEEKSEPDSSPEMKPNKSEKEIKEQNELAEFMKMTQQESIKVASEELNIVSEDRIENKQYVPPNFNKDKFVIIPQGYLKTLHALQPKEKEKKPKLYPHVRGHHLWKGEWAVLPAGGLGYIDQEKMNEQKKVLTYIIKRIGRNIFSGKGILNISLPVDIFCVESNIQRLAMSFGYFPFYLQKAASEKQPVQQLKHIIGSGLASSLIYMTMEKPFNPILGETYQCWIDGCPVYFEQISHHPPIAAFLMKGRGYTVSGKVEAKMDLSINSGTGNNEGIFTVQFDNGNTFYYTTPAGCLTGLTYGERKLNMVGKSFYWSEKGLFLELSYNPAAKSKGFFGGVKGEGDEKLPDYFQGQIKQYSPQALKQIAFKTQGNKLVPIIPKNAPSGEALRAFQKVYGRWNKYVKFGDEIIFDVDQNRYYSTSDEKSPLPSHSNFREDIVYRRMRNFIQSQQFKQVLEIKQREDRKLRAKMGPTKAH